jgi:hypothetical protein
MYISAHTYSNFHVEKEGQYWLTYPAILFRQAVHIVSRAFIVNRIYICPCRGDLQQNKEMSTPASGRRIIELLCAIAKMAEMLNCIKRLTAHLSTPHVMLFSLPTYAS